MADKEPKKAKLLDPAKQSIKTQSELEPIILPSNATVYANNLGIGMTVFDVVVTFGEVMGIRDGRAVIQQRVKVIMPPLLAKIFSGNLAKVVADYEKSFGEIKVPEGAGTVVEKSLLERA